MLGHSLNSSSNPGVQLFTLLAFMHISLLMWSQTLWKARLSCVPVALQFTSDTGCRKFTQISLIQPIFYSAVSLCKRLFEGFQLLPVTGTVSAGQQRAELLMTAASKVRGGLVVGAEECSFSSCLSTLQQMKSLLIPVSFLFRICHYLSFKLPEAVLFWMTCSILRHKRNNNFDFPGCCKSLFSSEAYWMNRELY